MKAKVLCSGCGYATIGVVEMTLRFEIFPDDLDADVAAERDQITAAGWPITEDLRDRPWGLRDFRVLDPAGYYLRITDRAPVARTQNSGPCP